MYITDDQRAWKVEQLNSMIEREEADERDDNAYGALLMHWSGCATPINIDGEALSVLRNHYDKEAHVWLLSYAYQNRIGKVRVISRVFYDLGELERFEEKLERGMEAGKYLDYDITAIDGVHH